MKFSVLFAGLGLALAVAGGGGAANANSAARVCPGSPIGTASCHALVVTDGVGNPNATTSPTGLSPATIKSAYNFPTSSTGAGQTIAIVDAYDDPTAESDLNVFSTQFGLPACTTANGCFTKVNQKGGKPYPKADAGWALEISLDIQWAHAIAPGAKILLVEATNPSFTNLLQRHARHPRRLLGARPRLRRLRLRQHAVPGPEGLVRGRRHQRLRPHVGGPLGRRRHRGQRRLRLQQRHHVPGHHQRQQRS